MSSHLLAACAAAYLTCATAWSQDAATAPAAAQPAAGAQDAATAPAAPAKPAVQDAPATPAAQDAPATQDAATQDAAAQDAAAKPAVPETTVPAEWLDADAVAARLAALAAAHADLARVDTLGLTLAGRPILALVVQAGDRPLADGQGLLIVGGLDGRRATDANVLLAAAEALLADAAGDLRARLGDAAVILVPRANPDGAQPLAAPTGPRHEQAGNGRPDDRDRDGRVDEDGPADLDGDGVIAWMAVPDGEGTWVFDEHDPRALRHARTERGERGTHRLLLEGRDADGDGAENEDDTDGVQPDANFPQGWREFAPEAGRYPLSEPESLALAEFVLDHPRLQAVLVLGAQDTLVSLPKAAGNAPGGGNFSGPLDGVHADDVAGLKELQRRLLALGRTQEHEHAVKGDGLAAGSFLAWTYHQAGRWPLALKTWAPPTELPKPGKPKGKDGEKEAAKDSEKDAAKDGEKDAAKDAVAASDDADAAQDGAAKGRKRKGDKAKDDSAKEVDDDKPTSDADSPAPAAVLAWLDKERAGAGFLPWHAFRHDQLGDVQLGGITQGTLYAASSKDVDALAKLLAPYALTLLDCLPRVAFEDLKVTGKGGVATVEVAVVNRGVLPTVSQLASLADLSRPLKVTLGLPDGAARLTGGSPAFIERLGGGGGRQTLRWVIAGASGQKVTLHVESPTVPSADVEFTLP